MGPYKPLRTWVDEFIPYYMDISWELIDPGTCVGTSFFYKKNKGSQIQDVMMRMMVEKSAKKKSPIKTNPSFDS